jgi:hypothetical protein
MVMADEAEVRGDAFRALDIMEAHAKGPDGQPFWRPWRVKYLMQLQLLGPDVPAWVTGRWLCNQALQSLQTDLRRVWRQAQDRAVELRGGRDRLPGRDDADAMGRVIDRDWVYRQLFLYELGGLDRFLRAHPSSPLLSRTASVHEWARTSMGGYQPVGSTPASVTWSELGSGRRHHTPNIGGAVLFEPGECVIGRLVPDPGGQVFESRPLLVPEALGRDVAKDPADWIDLLRAFRADRPHWEDSYRPLHDPVLTSDVPELIWQLALLPGPESSTGPEEDGAVARAVLDAAARAFETPPRPPHEIDAWPCIGAALLEPHVMTGLAMSGHSSDVSLLMRLSVTLAEPFATVCENLAMELFEAA